MTDAFDCGNCQHPSSRHTVKRWPAFTPYCQDCGCTGYQPHYKNPTRWEEDREAGAIG
jgi:hypothetical protein